MIDELELLRRLRPAVEPPTSAAREAALAQLRTTIAAEPAAPPRAEPEAHGARQGSHGEVHLSSELAEAENKGAPISLARRPARRPSLGSVASLLAVFGALVVAGGAIVLIGTGRNHAGRGAGYAGPRGQIVDRNGDALVGNRAVIEVQIEPPKLPPAGPARQAEYGRLARVLGVSSALANCRVPGRGVLQLPAISCTVTQQEASGSTATVTLANEVSARVARELRKTASRLPGVSTTRTYMRLYPLHMLASQVLGTVGRINPTEVHSPRDRGVQPNAVIGQSGLEYSYDPELRAGETLRLSLDTRLQQTAQQALEHAISANRAATGGAFVAMDPENGAVYAIGSWPTFDPNIFAKPLPKRIYRQLTSPSAGFPLLDRATQSSYPTGSTIKPITATSALQSGAWTTGEIYDDTGTFQNGPGDTRQNAGHAAYGAIDLTHAIQVGSDDFFFNLGRLMNSVAPNGGALQQWARDYGIGARTGIDVGGESAGVLPTPAWRAQRYKLENECERAIGPFKGRKRQSSCGIANGRPWSVGDTENLAVGQGDLGVTPLQLAVAYAAIANGGTIVRPHLGLEITRHDGTQLQPIDPPPARQLRIRPASLEAIRTGLLDAATKPGGTSADVFAGFPEPVYGQVGTAQQANQADTSLWAGYVPASATSKPIVVVIRVDGGGFGVGGAAGRGGTPAPLAMGPPASRAVAARSIPHHVTPSGSSCYATVAPARPACGRTRCHASLYDRQGDLRPGAAAPLNT